MFVWASLISSRFSLQHREVLPLGPETYLISLLDVSNPMSKGKLHVPPTATGKLDVGFGGTFPVSAEVPGPPVLCADDREIRVLEWPCWGTGVRRDGARGAAQGAERPPCAPGEPVAADTDPGLLQESRLAQCAFLA